jgi:phosphoglycerate dehydrogenase-like enzyme
LLGPPLTADRLASHPELLVRAEVILSSWGAPLVDEDLLARAPRLQAVFYAAGAVGGWMTEAAWDRGVLVTTAASGNAVPVAEFTLATILLSQKHAWRLARQTRADRSYHDRGAIPGNYRSTVGLISLGVIARTLLDLLRPFDLDVLVYDPFLTDADAEALNVRRVSLEELFRRCDVVSLHAPDLPETRGLITGTHIASMRTGATFINTARGVIVREEELLDVLATRPDLQAVMDTATHEPPPPDSRLYTLDNVVLTPHIAGSVGPECRRMGRMMVQELERYVRREPLKWGLTRESAMRTAHRPQRSGRRGGA